MPIENIDLRTFQSASDWIANSVAEIRKDLPRDTSFSLALSGGNTPILIYEALAMEDVPWQNAQIFQADERYISSENPDSNQKLLREHFLEKLPAQPQVFFFPTPDQMSWQDAAKNYDDILKEQNREFDVCILGLGSDGHTASLFPNGPELLVTEKMATTSETNVFAVWKRLTLTFPKILSSKKLILLLRGAEKKAVLNELLYGKKSWQEFPTKKLLEHSNLHIFFYEN